jgi:hypothetical protein
MFFSVSTLVNPLLHEHFVKNGCFIEKSPVTSSNCYKTMKTASILIKLGTRIDWTIAFVSLFTIKIVFKMLQLLNGLR